jgi:hypothetical protein
LKRFAFLFFVGFSLSASAQYLGGSGDGDIKTGISNKLLDGSVGNAVWFFGGSGDGDVKARGASILLGGTPATAVWFYGGSGDGDVKSVRLSNSFLGEVEWVGTTSTDWSTTGNWRQNALPPDGRVKISSNAVRDLVLDQTRSITSLDFNSAGKQVYLGNFNLTVSGTIVGASSTNFIKTNGTGSLRATLATGTSFTFPIGNAYYNPVTITNSTGSSDLFDARVLDEVYLMGTSGNALYSPRVAATWIINKSSGTSNLGNGVDFSFVFDNAQKRSFISNLNIRLFHYAGSQWSKQAGTGSINVVSNTLTYTYTQYKGAFSPFSLGDDLQALPLNWVSINCLRKAASSALVQWKTNEEVGVVSYTIERSLDGIQFTPIGNVSAQGGTAAVNTYSFNDTDAPIGSCFYRVKENNVFGNPSFSRVCICAAFDVNLNTRISIFPNPSNNQFQISTPAHERIFEYRLLNASGKLQRSGTGSNGRTQVSTTALPAGVYYLVVDVAGNRITQPVLVSH